MNPKKIYLSGPIMDCAPQESKDWRTRAKERLAGRFILLDPMRRTFRTSATPTCCWSTTPSPDWGRPWRSFTRRTT